MTRNELTAILTQISGTRIAVYGDFCLDAYWILDDAGGEISVETGYQAQAVRQHYYTLGGASNVVANLAALQPASISIVGIIGDDIFGREMLRQFDQLGIDYKTLIISQNSFDTVVFGKRYLQGLEKPRIDFGFFNQRSAAQEDQIITNLEQVLERNDVLIFNQQVPNTLSLRFIAQANRLFSDFARKIIIVDSRHYGSEFHGTCRQTNEAEAAAFSQTPLKPGRHLSEKKLKAFARHWYSQLQKPIFITCGSGGLSLFDELGFYQVPALQLQKPLDPVGAGDTTVSALAGALACGLSARVAAQFAVLAAAVTVQKLFQTGVAVPQEILDIYDQYF
ncbi:MAG: hypothetical protein EHM72_18320 [Calditrichaeota bacterium]|nr:MAG: hypothetical protein EHM72_18320 [Calditrichota bacterium]